MRIISGEYGGRPLKASVSDETRPTTDKIKESMFNLIGPYFDGGIVLDLYAGTGALAIEAVSRGADEAYLIDTDPDAIKSINKNIEITKDEEKFFVFRMPAEKALHTFLHKQITFDLVFIDPPYASDSLVDDLEWMVVNELLNTGALVVCETSTDFQMPEHVGPLHLYKQKEYGQTLITIYEQEKLDE